MWHCSSISGAVSAVLTDGVWYIRYTIKRALVSWEQETKKKIKKLCVCVRWAVSTSPRVRTAYEGRRCCGSGRRLGTGGQAHSVLARCRRTNPAPAAVLDERKPLAWHGLAARQPGIHTARVSERARDTREKDTLDSGFDDWSQWAREPSWGPVVPIRKFEGWPWRGAPSFSSVPCCTTFVLVLCTDGRTAAHHSPIEARAPRTYMSAGMI